MLGDAARPVEGKGIKLKKKLIEVALPLEAINKESAREKSIRHGHPSTLHLWWARRPLAACRAVLFASLVDDPGSRPDPDHGADALVGEHFFKRAAQTFRVRVAFRFEHHRRVEF